jgi:hypothetical protein
MLDQVMKPTEEISVRDVFGIDTDMRVKGFAERTDRVPEIDTDLQVRSRHHFGDSCRVCL